MSVRTLVLSLVLGTTACNVPLVLERDLEAGRFLTPPSEAETEAVMALVNTASFELLDLDVGLDRRAAQGIVDRRPLADLDALDAVPYVGDSALAKLVDWVVANDLVVEDDADDVDDDGDGFGASVDCDDADPAVYPGALEICDGLDNDCDDATTEDGLITHDGRTNYDDLTFAVSNIMGGTLDVCPGVYTGTLFVDIPMTVRGVGDRAQIVLTSTSGRTIDIYRATGVVLEGLTVTTSGATSGGIAIRNGSSAVLTDLHVVGNRTAVGAGIDVRVDSSATITDSLIEGNVASGDGGGLMIYDGSEVTMTATVLRGNVASKGGGFRTDIDGSLTMTDCAVVGNVASVRGGGGYMGSSFGGGELDGLIAYRTDWGTGADDNQAVDLTLQNRYVTRDFDFDFEDYNYCNTAVTWHNDVTCY